MSYETEFVALITSKIDFSLNELNESPAAQAYSMVAGRLGARQEERESIEVYLKQGLALMDCFCVDTEIEIIKEKMEASLSRRTFHRQVIAELKILEHKAKKVDLQLFLIQLALEWQENYGNEGAQK